MSEEEILSLNGYLADLYQAMQIGDIVFEAKDSSELYNLINKLLKENQKYKEVINKAINYINNNIIGIDIKSDNIMLNRTELLDILKEVEHE